MLTVSHDSVTLLAMDWTLDELVDRVRAALAVGYPGQRSGRVREVPDARAIRYYTTLGLVDRPAVVGGRGARYGERHLLQLVAIKRLQAQGLSLAEVQQELAGVRDDRLREFAQVPAEAVTAAARPQTGRSRRFWAGAPASAPSGAGAASTPLARSAPPERAGADRVAEAPEAADDGAEPVLYGIQLAPGALLLVESPRAPRPNDQRALRQAAAPLLETLRARGLVPATSPDPTQRSDP
jgi:DNA-binding transcriptional MerR regulator